MSTYTSRYAELGFYVNGELRRFRNGEYRTDNADEAAVLDALVDAVKEQTEELAEKPASKQRKATSAPSET
ncbi:hypothetical protein PASE110613_09130 [Paenibacillus sediminis]|uniref:Uncharacterized protein n=1 Tax=Paenibacillus sediminis TaxID=664909 RepID=A0ABS4H6N3_9BACL|nr:hypothetical protein [Paenibacillus sediminis]MBP1938191.1 hypothetical protein [Paenibacillus sediminis]